MSRSELRSVAYVLILMIIVLAGVQVRTLLLT
jgi:hypothetical protein